MRLHILFVVLFALIAVAFVPQTEALVERVFILDYPVKWIFLTKFSFYNGGHNETGLLSLKVNPNFQDTRDVKLVLYSDEPHSFPELQKNFDKLTCQEKLKPEEENGTAKAVISLSEFPDFSIPIIDYYQHFWYVVVAACDRNSSVTELEFTLTLENPGGFFTRQFSMHEWGLLEIHIIFLLVLLGLGVVYGIGIFKYFRARALHLIVQVFAVAVYTYLIGVFFVWIHLIKFAGDGYGVGGLEGLGIVFKTVSEVVLIFLLLLIAQGWTIQTPYLPNKKITGGVFITVVILYAILFIWVQVGVDPADYLFLYDTPPGIILNILRLPLCGFFIYSIIKCYRAETEDKKRSFFKIFAFSYSAWFLILPVITIIAAIIYQSHVPWRMYSPAIVEAVSSIAFTASLIGLTYLLWPSRVNEIFQISATGSISSYDAL